VAVKRTRNVPPPVRSLLPRREPFQNFALVIRRSCGTPYGCARCVWGGGGGGGGKGPFRREGVEIHAGPTPQRQGHQLALARLLFGRWQCWRARSCRRRCPTQAARCANASRVSTKAEQPQRTNRMLDTTSSVTMLRAHSSVGQTSYLCTQSRSAGKIPHFSPMRAMAVLSPPGKIKPSHPTKSCATRTSAVATPIFFSMSTCSEKDPCSARTPIRTAMAGAMTRKNDKRKELN
jgi:hypothetical protein